MQPLQACTLDPVGSIFDAAGMEVECGAYAEHQSGLNQRQQAHHESLLLGSADAYPEDLGVQYLYSRRNGLFFFESEIAEGWSVGSNNASPRETLREAGAEFLDDSFFATVKEVSAVGELRPAKDFQHKIGTGDALHLSEALPAPQPHSRHSVRHGKRGPSVNLSKPWIALGFHDSVDTDHADVAFALLR